MKEEWGGLGKGEIERGMLAAQEHTPRLLGNRSEAVLL